MTKKRGAAPSDPSHQTGITHRDENLSTDLERILDKMSPDALKPFLEGNWYKLTNKERKKVNKSVKDAMEEYDPRKPSGNQFVYKEWFGIYNDYVKHNGTIRSNGSTGADRGRVPALDPDKWFRGEKVSIFVPYQCAKDYLRVFPNVITEYRGTIHQFTGRFYLKDAEGTIKTNIENAGTGRIKPKDIHDAVESLANQTRIIDPAKIDEPMERIMPLPDHTIPVEEGLLNLITKQIMPHSPAYFYTEYIPVHYIPGAVPEIFISFLDKVFTGDPDAELKKTTVFETIAWMLMPNYDIHGAVIFYGQGGEGKSIIFSVIESLLGHTSSLSLKELESDKFKRPELYGSWANLISEGTTEMINSEWFKKLTDGTVFTADRKNGHPFRMVNRGKFLMGLNGLSIKENELRAFYRRIIAIIDFPNMLESILTPVQISEFVKKMKDPAELDKIFSYTVDNYYGPLVSRMKFTNHLTIAEAEKKWEERSNPAKSYLEMKNEAGEILTDVDKVKPLLKGDINREKRYISRETNGEEYLAMIKKDVIADAIKWAMSKGFPAKTINGGTLGKALTSLGFPNLTVDKKVSKGSVVKAWKDIYIDIDEGRVTDEVADHAKPPLPPGNQSKIDKEQFGSGSTPLPLHECANAHGENREVSATKMENSLNTTEEKQVTGNLEHPLPESLPLHSEIADCLKNPHGQNGNGGFSNNQKKVIFDLVKWKAPESKYGALRVTEIHDMIRVTYPSFTLTEIHSVCRELYDMGAFLKSEHGSYSVNPDYVPEGDLA